MTFSFYLGILMLCSLKFPLSAWVWQAAQLDALFTFGFFQVRADTSSCSCWNQRVSVMRRIGLPDVACRLLPAFFSRKALISLVAAGSRLASLPKCLSRPDISARHDSAGSKRGG